MLVQTWDGFLYPIFFRILGVWSGFVPSRIVYNVCIQLEVLQFHLSLTENKLAVPANAVQMLQKRQWER